jgi:L-ascorbate metabolism protein UlaG (beta-lactamase superfamily)
MDVSWLGHGCFRLRGRSAAVVTDPYPPTLGTRLPRLEADLVTISHEHPNHSHAQIVHGDPFVIHGPGEYEVAGVAVLGLATFHDTASGAERGRNTVYVIEVDDVRVCHLGDLGHRLVDDQLEAIGTVDVVLAPVGGGAALDGAAAAEVVRQLEPRIVVPMHFRQAGLKTSLEPAERFLKEMGVESAEAQPRLSVQPTSGDSDTTRVVLLEPRAGG